MDVHPGCTGRDDAIYTPVRSLGNNIVAKFESARAQTLARLTRDVQEGKIQPGIQWWAACAAPRAPRAEWPTRQIILQEVFLAYLWGITYSLFVLEEEGWRRQLISGGEDPEPEVEHALQEATMLFR